MSTYAILDTTGRQVQIQLGRFYSLNRYPILTSYQNLSYRLYRVLIVRYISHYLLGQPWVPDAFIQGRMCTAYRSYKLTVYKMQPKKKTRRKQGARHWNFKVLVTTIHSSTVILP